MLAIRTLGTYLDRARSARRFTRKLNIYNTEFGLQSNPPDRIVSTSLSRQAALINEKEEYAYRYSRLKSHSQYLLYDDPARPGPLSVKWSGFQTGAALRERPAPSPPTTRTGSRSSSRSAAAASTCGAACARVRDRSMCAYSARAAASGPASRPIRAGTSA